MSDFIIGFLNLAIFIAGILLIGLILIQRGKGGGLAGTSAEPVAPASLVPAPAMPSRAARST